MEYNLIIFAMLAGYGVGSIPFGYIIAAMVGRDIRQEGSGNVGATNITRRMGKIFGLVTFLFDFGKAYGVTLFFVHDDFMLAAYVAALAALLGHIAPVWLQFRGGKGVACLLGILAVFDVTVMLVLVFLWMVVFLLSHYASLASIVMAFATPLALWANGASAGMIVTGAIMAIMVLGCHSSNITNLRCGREYRFEW